MNDTTLIVRLKVPERYATMIEGRLESTKWVNSAKEIDPNIVPEDLFDL